MMQYLKIGIIGIVFALIIDIFGIVVGVVKCLANGIEVKSATLLSVAMGTGAKEGIFGGLVVIVVMLISMPRPRSPH